MPGSIVGMKATWNGQTLAESSDTVVVEGNHYFPEASLAKDHFKPSHTITTFAWKCFASYY